MFVEYNGNKYLIDIEERESLDKLRNAVTDWTIKMDATNKELEIWVTGNVGGYQLIKLNDSEIDTDAISQEQTVTVYGEHMKAVVKELCISDISFELFKNNEDEFDFNMRCWSGKYQYINRHDEYMTSFISNTGCSAEPA
eukprot:428945_1